MRACVLGQPVEALEQVEGDGENLVPPLPERATSHLPTGTPQGFLASAAILEPRERRRAIHTDKCCSITLSPEARGTPRPLTLLQVPPVPDLGVPAQ